MMGSVMRRCIVLLACVLLAACGKPDSAPQIAAASDLRLVLPEIAAAFERDTGQRVELNFGASGNFYRQLQQDAPFEMFLSADESYVTGLVDAGRTLDEGRLYAVGRIALVVPHGSPLALDPELADLRAALVRGAVTRFAIANPDHAPYGQRAREALEYAGLWDDLEGKLVLGENVSQAAQFAIAGGAQGGIVAHSLVLDPAVASQADHVLIPAAWHQPLRQRMVLMKDAGDTARSFYAYLTEPAAREILARYGFTLPEGAN